VTVRSDPSLFTAAQLLRASSRADSGSEAATRVAPTGERVALPVRAAPSGGTCTVDYTVTPTANPSEEIPGSTDDRELGLHFDAFLWEPRR